MSYNRDNFVRIKNEYLDRNRRAREEAEARASEINNLFPEIREINNEIAGYGLRCLEAAQKFSGEKLESELFRLKKRTEELTAKKARLLAEKGYPSDYDFVKYKCAKCSDTGFCGINMCDCMKQELIKAGIDSSGISALFEKMNFDTFSPNYYDSDNLQKEQIESVFSYCKNYADSFNCNSENLLFVGGTGVGKTHLSVAIAKEVTEKGYDVVFKSAQDLISDFEFERFHKSYSDVSPAKTDKYYECDLLIIDDLGSEMTNQFTVSCVLSLMNSRINSGKPTIISTNMTPDKFKTYDERIASRLNDFTPFLLHGKDIRSLRRDKWRK
ncbi:MAG: ATP-binding protein [Clostridia bacterium]|nr:ATP-binding protein [Clostridia bacterium]